MFQDDPPKGSNWAEGPPPISIDRMTYAARDIAAELRRRFPDLPKKKLHKLLYYCQGHHLAAFGRPAFAESISAWDMGPVVGQLFYEENHEIDHAPPVPVTAEDVLNTVGYVLSRYGGLTGRDLENLTHQEDPWRNADIDRPSGGTAKITNPALIEYFRQRDEDDDLTGQSIEGWLSEAESWQARSIRPDSVDRLRARLSNA